MIEPTMQPEQIARIYAHWVVTDSERLKEFLQDNLDTADAKRLEPVVTKEVTKVAHQIRYGR